MTIQKIYCQKTKRIYWLIGYLGGMIHTINISKAHEIALEYSKEYNIDIETIYITEINASLTSMYHKYIYSETTIEAPPEGWDKVENFIVPSFEGYII
jgi:hypothetical protein